MFETGKRKINPHLGNHLRHRTQADGSEAGGIAVKD